MAAVLVKRSIYQYPHQFFRHHFIGKRLFSVRLQLSKERLICFFFLIFRQTTAQLHAIILMTFKILCVPLPPRGPHVIHYVAQVQLMSNILVAHQLIKCCSEVAKNLFQCFYYLEMLLQVKKRFLFSLCKNSTTSLRHSQFLFGSYVV